MFFAFGRRAALRPTAGSRRRVPTTRKPSVDLGVVSPSSAVVQ
jgi:hypothetical protein